MKKKALTYFLILAGFVFLCKEGRVLAADTSAFTARTAGAASVIEETKDDEADEKEKLAAENNLWGYKNLGIAHVDNHLNVREKPDENSSLLGKMSKGAACEILSTENGWAHIKSGKLEGYAHTEFLFTGAEAKKQAMKYVSTMAIVTTKTLKVREEPNTDSPVVTLIPEGEELEVVAREDGWVKFMLDDDEAYVAAQFVKIEQKLTTGVTMKELMYDSGISNSRVDLCQYAKQFVGNPYVWGGTSLTHGADCSGFTMSIFAKYGIALPHSAAAQSNCGTKIKASQAQPGDLFFYAKGGRINHVAIYIGNGQVLHASSPRTGIKISGAYYRSPATVRRLLP